MFTKLSHIYEHAEFVVHVTIAEKNSEKRNRRKR